LIAVRGFFASVRAATARLLLNVQVKHATFYQAGPLEGLMRNYVRANGPNRVKLANFVRRLSVNVTHIVRRNRAGHTIPRIKAIAALAMTDDGQNMEHRPIVPKFGAGPKEVKFFIGGTAAVPPGNSQDQSGKSDGKTGKKASKVGPPILPLSEDGYITVYDFFRNSKLIQRTRRGRRLS
jgi:hypothetical protein